MTEFEQDAKSQILGLKQNFSPLLDPVSTDKNRIFELKKTLNDLDSRLS